MLSPKYWLHCPSLTVVTVTFKTSLSSAWAAVSPAMSDVVLFITAFALAIISSVVDVSLSIMAETSPGSELPELIMLGVGFVDTEPRSWVEFAARATPKDATHTMYLSFDMCWW